MAGSAICSFPGCYKRHHARGWCSTHHKRWLHSGDPSPKAKQPGKAQKYYVEAVLPYDGNECLIWPYHRMKNGYAILNVQGVPKLTHRLVCAHVHGDAPTSEHQAAHSCGNGHLGCVTKRHMSWKTRVENAADQIVHGTRITGSKNHNAKLTQEQADEIREMAKTFSNRKVAKMMGISFTTVNAIVSNKRWVKPQS